MSETTELTWTPARENLGLHKPVDVEIRGTGLELVLRFASRLPEPPGAQRALAPVGDGRAPPPGHRLRPGR